MKIFKILLMSLATISLLNFSTIANAGDGCMIVNDPDGGTYEICPNGPGGGPAPAPTPDPDPEPMNRVAMVDGVFNLIVVRSPDRGCDKDGNNCTHRCTINGVCKPIPKPAPTPDPEP